MNRNRSPLVITAAILVALGALLAYFSGYYVDWLWFNSVDFTSVWTTVLTTKIELFLIVGILTSLTISLNIYLAYKRRPLSMYQQVSKSAVLSDFVHKSNPFAAGYFLESFSHLPTLLEHPAWSSGASGSSLRTQQILE